LHNPPLKPEEIGRIIEMAWDDLTPFESIRIQFQLGEKDVIRLMRTELKPASYRVWRRRVSGRLSKHQKRSELRPSLNDVAERVNGSH
jgi:uncharacterized protein (TIGR03643 family)